MSKHTPGRWFVGPTNRRDEKHICASGPGGRIELARAYDYAECAGPLPVESNARLIAAAPRLLVALVRTLDYAIGHATDARGIGPIECEGWPWVMEARAAIAKATGAKALTDDILTGGTPEEFTAASLADLEGLAPYLHGWGKEKE
jgi:hypothetical protein